MISVAMPAYNSERYVGEAIESILTQTYSDFEFIVVDDGSTDGTLNVIESYAKRDGRIRVLRQANCGPSRARNRAVEESCCDWIAFVDHDDIARPQRLERQVEASRAKPQVVIWGTDVCEIGPAGQVLTMIQVGLTCPHFMCQFE